MQRYQRLAFSVALRMLGSSADAEDIAQQAFVDAFNALDRFRGEGRRHAFSTWLLRIAVNRSKDVLKSKRRTEEPLEQDVRGGEAAFAYDPSTPEANASSDERRQHLEAALLKLPTKYREVLILKDAEDLSYEEIRTILQLPITTLKIRVDPRPRPPARAHRARRADRARDRPRGDLQKSGYRRRRSSGRERRTPLSSSLAPC